jgi:hypothetical protein
MALKPSYLKNNIKLSFFGRKIFINKFNEMFDSCQDKEFSVLNFYGVGGIGKTTLLRECRKKVDEDIFVFNYDFDNFESIYKFYEQLSESLIESKIPSNYILLAYLEYWKKINPSMEAKERLPSFITKSEEYSSILEPFAESVAATIGASGIMKMLYKGVNKAQELTLDPNKVEEIKELQNKEVDEIEQLLPKFISYDIQNFINKKPSQKILFLFDTYEVLWDDNKKIAQRGSVDEWISDLVLSLEKCNTFFVIAGREKIDWVEKDEEWNEYIEFKKLDNFTNEETYNLLKSINISDEISDKITQISSGYPFYIELCLDIMSKKQNPFDFLDEQLDIIDIVHRFIKYLDADEILVVEYLAIAQKFDKDLYMYLAKKFGFNASDIFYDNLLKYSFFIVENSFIKVHKNMSKSILDTLGKDKIEIVHEAIFHFYNEKYSIKDQTDSFF